MFKWNPMSTIACFNLMSLMQAVTDKGQLWWLEKPCTSLSKKVRLYYLLEALLSEVHASWQLGQLNNDLCDGQTMFGAKVHLVEEVFELKQVLYLLSHYVCIWLAIGYYCLGTCCRLTCDHYMTLSSILMPWERRFLDVCGFIFLEQNFPSLELLIAQSPKNHTLFERVLLSSVVGTIS